MPLESRGNDGLPVLSRLADRYGAPTAGRARAVLNVLLGVCLIGVTALGLLTPYALVGLPLLLALREVWRAENRRVYDVMSDEVRKRAAAERTQSEQADRLRETAEVLARTNEELEAASELKNQFVGVVSHELRTPITAIGGLATTLVQHWDRIEDSERRQFVERMRQQARRQERIVDDLLTLSQIMAGQLVTSPQVINPFVVVSDAATDLGLPVEISGEIDLRVLVDTDHLYRILSNLLSNAVKYGAPPYRVEAARTREGVELRVVDHGDGLDDDFVAHAFDEFRQASAGERRTSEGVGLGLSIVRRLADANGGRAFYRDLGEGGCFGLLLREAGRSAAVVPAADEDGDLAPPPVRVLGPVPAPPPIGVRAAS